MLGSLPSELTIAVLSELDFRSLLIFRQVSRDSRALVDATPGLQYKIELAIAGMVDGPDSNMTTEERRRRLVTYQENWANLRWKQEEVLQALDGDSDLWELDGDVLALSGESDSLSLRQLPGIARGKPSKTWKIKGVGPEFKDLRVDSTQDLVVLVEMLPPIHVGATSRIPCRCRIHTRSLSTGEPHPAGLPVGYFISEPLNVRHQETQLHIHVLGDRLAIGFSTYHPHGYLCMWQWKVGALEMCLQSIDDIEIHSFTFLTRDSFLLASMSGGRAGLSVHSLKDDVEDRERGLTPYFLYPNPPECDYCLSIRYLPTPLAPAGLSGSQAPFDLSPDSKIIAVMIKLFTPNGTVCWTHIIPVSVFLSLLHQSRSDHACVEWVDWASERTCLIDNPFPSLHWTCCVSGSRFVTSTRIINQTGLHPHHHFEVSVYDFNQFAIRHDLAHGRRSGVTLASVVLLKLPDAESSDEDEYHALLGYSRYVTRLPYRKETVVIPPLSIGPYVFGTAMISKDSLILVDDDDESKVGIAVLSF
ncbi:hypothetical protein JAAARDRAFT_70916 [Jaapia argillacea MUCL 33604]|uniref:F-box domain-containing protein n=1 Tax=Jaapia argillacea MUCL 33604 TaxID=933084 RepID=A0A067PQL9_9AGAM|nr:hypothetical protein JAAARDRAFT_70916 [Jaapia argillacea MUCL 33604]